MPTPRSVRLDDSILESLSSFVLRHPGLSTSSAISMLVSEGLRMEQHPGVTFRDGPAGRRAVVLNGADVWQVISAVLDVRRAEPTITPHELIDAVAKATGAEAHHVRVALDYYGAHADEIDLMVRDNRDTADAWEAALARRETLLSS